jgi:hypothetical protein
MAVQLALRLVPVGSHTALLSPSSLGVVPGAIRPLWTGWTGWLLILDAAPLDPESTELYEGRSRWFRQLLE